MNYQTKPIKVEAMQWKGILVENVNYVSEFADWVKKMVSTATPRLVGQAAVIVLNDIYFDGNQVELTLRPNEWLVTHPYYGLLAFSNDDFKNKYEECE